MIEAEDFRFHPHAPDDSWTETLFLIFSVPEAGVSGNLYTLARPDLGVCHSSVEIHRGICLNPWEIHHNDSQMHLRCPDDFSDFSLANGLRFKALDERKCMFAYESQDGNCALHLEYEALCAPFDPHDVTDNPLAGSKVEGYDGWNNGHMDSKGRATGWLRLRGKEYRVDCNEGMDKSWGPRNDWGNQSASWILVNLGDQISALMVLEIHFEDRELVYGPFKFGFIARDGERRSIVKATMRAKRSEMLITRAVISFEDDRGLIYNAIGTTIAAAPWYNFNPSSAAFQTLMRWESEHGVGYSHIADFSGLNHLSQGLAEKFGDR